MVASAWLVAGCGGGREAAPRRITRDEASVLADTLVRNYEAGGARVVASVRFGVLRIRLDGEIDWRNHVGRVTVRSTGASKKVPPFDVVFNQRVAFEQVPGLAAALTARGRPPKSWVARPMDAAGSRLHLLLTLIDSTSSTQRDNPVALASKGIRWLRRDRVGAVEVDVFDAGRTVTWVGRRDRRTHRLQADLAATGSVATLTFDDFGERVIDVPADPDIVAYDDVADLYRELMG